MWKVFSMIYSNKKSEFTYMSNILEDSQVN